MISVGGTVIIGGSGGGGASLSDATPAAPGTAAAGIGTSASRDDHVHTPTTAAQVGLGAVTATGATEAAARAAIGAVGNTRTVYDFSSSSGWTADAGTTPGASAAITGGVARLVLPSGTTYRYAGNYNGPSLTIDLGAVTSLLDVAVRLVSVPLVGTTQSFLEISETNPGGSRIAAMITGAGATYCYRQDANTFDAGATIAITTDTWLRIRAAAGAVTAYYGVGSGGALPTTWTAIAAPTIRSVAWRYVALGLVHVGSGVTVDLDDLVVLHQPLATL